MKNWTLGCTLLALLMAAAACTHEVLPPEKFASATGDAGKDGSLPADGESGDALGPEVDTQVATEDSADVEQDTPPDVGEDSGATDAGPTDAGSTDAEPQADGNAKDAEDIAGEDGSGGDGGPGPDGLGADGAADAADGATSDTAAPDCAKLCDDGNLCTTDDCDGESCIHTDNTLPCQDGDLCTVGDVCAGGGCKPGTPKDCSDGNVCTDDLCKSAVGCALANNATSCSDNDPCTLGDTCGGGTCKAGVPNLCDDNNDCTKDACYAGSGCKHSNVGDSCDDGDACTVGDSCANGKCTPGSKKTCDDGNPCTNDACDPTAGCTAVPTTAVCDDNNKCTNGDVCANGSCKPGAPAKCDDGNVCTTDSCNANSGCANTATTSPCDDNNKCTTSDTCKSGACAGGAAPNCDDSNDCTTDSCVPATGCAHTALANDTVCNDGNACTTTDKCNGGLCVGSGGKDCNDKNPCTLDSCDKTKGCTHTNNGALCDDGNQCTEQDRCAGGTCSEFTPKVCDDGKVCTDNACDPSSGNCSYPNNTASCDDGSKCTTIDTCADGACKGAQDLDCNDGNPCTDDSCDANAGCKHANNTVSCDDGSVCTGFDTCGGGKCSGTAIVCSDGNLCTDDSCDAVTGCVHTNNTVSCDDGNDCTSSSTCAGGSCSVVVKVADGTSCGGSQDKGCSAGVCKCKLYAASEPNTSSAFYAVAADSSGGAFVAGTYKDMTLGTVGFVDHRNAFNVSTSGWPLKLISSDKTGLITVNSIAGTLTKGQPFWAVAANEVPKVSTQAIVYSITDTGISTVGKPTGAGYGDTLYGAAMLSDGSAVMVGVASPTYAVNGLLPSGDSKLPQGWILKYAKGGTTPSASKLYKSGFGLALRSATRLLSDAYVMAVGWQYITDSKGSPATTPTSVIDQACAVIIDTSTGVPQAINGGAAIQVANHNTTGNSQTELYSVALESASGSTAKVVAAGQTMVNGTWRPLLWRATLTYSAATGAWSVTQDSSATLSATTGKVWSVVGLGGTYDAVFGNTAGNPYGGRVDGSTCGFGGSGPVCGAATWSKTSSSVGDVRAATLLSSGYLMAVGQLSGIGSLTVMIASTGSTTCP